MANILVAEDEPTERGLLVRGLAADGHTVTEAENGLVALQRLQANPGAFHVLVTDVDMPEIDGIELARRALAVNASLKVLLISGFTGSMDRCADLVSHGARSLVKPLALDKVRAEVRALLG